MKSFFQTSGAAIVAAVSVVVFFIINRHPTPVVFFSVCALWLCGMTCAAFVLRSLSPYPLVALPVMVSVAIAGIALFVLVEISLWRMILALVTSSVIGFFFWRNPDTHVPIDKPLRRMKMMALVGSVYGIHTAMYALSLFFNAIPLWALIVVASGLSTAIGVYVWKLYYDVAMQRFGAWIVVQFMLTVEILWSVALLPFHYFALGLFATWVWYILHILIRFHFHPSGIEWKRQRWFLGLNAVLFFFIMYIVRWI